MQAAPAYRGNLQKQDVKLFNIYRNMRIVDDPNPQTNETVNALIDAVRFLPLTDDPDLATT